MSAISLRSCSRVLVVERHRPAAVAGALARRRTASTHSSGCPNRPTRPCRARPCRRRSAWRRRRGASRRARARTRAPSPRISRPSASVLMTSTVLPLAPVRTSPGLMRASAGHVLGHRHDADHADGRAEQRDGAHGADDGRAAGHVVLHPLHAVGRLDRDAAGVERDALPDQPEDRRAWRAGRLVLHARSRAAVRRCRARRRGAGPCRAARSPFRRGLPPAALRPLRSAAARSAKTRGVSTFDGSLQSARARLHESPRIRPRSTARSRSAARACPSAAATSISSAAGPRRSPVLY